MSEQRGPVSTAWSILWLIVAAVFVMWLVTKVLVIIWPWLVGTVIVAACMWLLIVWLRRGRDRL